MSLISKYANPGQDIWYDPSFKAVLEDHLGYLRNHPNTTVQLVEPNALIKYRFDLYSLFRLYGVEQHHHWLVMRLNNFETPIDDFSQMEVLMIPNFTEVSKILMKFMSRNKKRGK